VLRAHQPVRRFTQFLRTLHERGDVAFTIGHIHQSRVRQGPCLFGHDLIAFDIKIGVIAEAQAIAGASIPQAAQMAADEINAKGGVDGRKIEIVTYDNHSSSADSVRAFQRAVNEDKVNA
jgi:ABC-type branched-subunit amino acid transport system substrate-binding protein